MKALQKYFYIWKYEWYIQSYCDLERMETKCDKGLCSIYTSYKNTEFRHEDFLETKKIYLKQKRRRAKKRRIDQLIVGNMKNISVGAFTE